MVHRKYLNSIPTADMTDDRQKSSDLLMTVLLSDSDFCITSISLVGFFISFKSVNTLTLVR